MSTYTYKSFGTAKTDLLARLDSSTAVFYTAVECGLYIKEALRCWNAAAQYSRARATFTATSASTVFYDLNDTLSTGGGATNPPALVGPTLTDRDLTNDIQYALMEPPTTAWAGGWTGTEMYTMSDVVNAIQRRRDQFLLQTGLVITHSSVTVPSPPASGRVSLSESIIDFRRVAFAESLAATYTALWRDDEWDAAAFKPSWATTAAPPEAYSAYLTPHVGLQLIPISSQSGTLDLLTINAGAALDVVSGILLGIPDDFAWVVKYGALVDLLTKDGRARDPFRAAYCQQRWDEGIQLAQLPGLLQAVQIAGVSAQPSTLTELDAFQPGWQAVAGTSTPTTVATAGRNLVALANAPDAGPYSVTVDMVINQPVPAADGDFLQVGKEVYDCILSYSEHLAAFKMSGQEFGNTVVHLRALMDLAADNNAHLAAQAGNYRSMQMESWKDFVEQPMRTAA